MDGKEEGWEVKHVNDRHLGIRERLSCEQESLGVLSSTRDYAKV